MGKNKLYCEVYDPRRYKKNSKEAKNARVYDGYWSSKPAGITIKMSYKENGNSNG
jgi:hypothetical protein